MKTCIKCGQERAKGRRLCKECYKESKREYARKRFLENGRYMYKKICDLCHKEFSAYRKAQSFCSSCNKKRANTLTGNEYCNNQYLYNSRGKPQHRVIVEQLLGKKLSSNQVIHHLDGNPKNNDLTNLIVISRSKHGKLHLFLRTQRVILEQSSSDNGVNCWNNLIVPITTTWLETAGVKVIKIWEIGQSAAKHLVSDEGSETKHSASHRDDDIVQTTTQKGS